TPRRRADPGPRRPAVQRRRALRRPPPGRAVRRRPRPAAGRRPRRGAPGLPRPRGGAPPRPLPRPPEPHTRDRSAHPSGRRPDMTHAPDTAVDGPGYGTLSIASILAETARRFPERTALYFLGRPTTYGELWDRTRAYAGALAARGIGPGSRVAMIVPNVPDFPRVYYAALALGAVVVPVHLLFRADEIEFVLRDAEADVVVAAAPMLAEAAPAAARAGVPLLTVLMPEDAARQAGVARLEDEAAAATPIERHVGVNPLAAATILYTSGTTGTPKGAVGSHLAMVEQVHCSLIDSFDLRPDDVVYGGLPFFHSFGQMAVLNMAFRRGASIVLLPKFDPDEALELLVTHGATVFTAVPTNFAGMVEAARRTAARPPLRYAVSGGAALPVAL